MKCPKRKDYPIECIFDFSPRNIVIPLDWTPAQAHNITSTIQFIDERIWSIYGELIIAQYRENCLIDRHEQLCAEVEALRNSLNDDIPF
jgi:hypothetical protein